MHSNDEIIDLMDSIRKEKNISISELSRKVGMSKSGVSLYFNKTRKFPLDRANVFAQALGTTPEKIIGVKPKLSNDNSIDLSNLRERIVMFDGKPLSDDDVSKIEQIIKLSLGVTGNEDK
ncbi:TPA: helix-turn-helix domain-containing protein [Streptococcus agalactiae]|uniref:helix-turn-helix domain-containing protein n=1 Tax=Streptococcus agalactiae TaxID=1311 RepID=UPI00005BB248|nr:helix-turn-helix transcriptional regulator [Streptococcus agalactiae]AYJ75074.1 cI repressor [Streptococcus phage LF4]QBX22339.1 putative cI-like repressor [Streptococcus phage Javan7]ABA44826.1 prophage LambdaSa03, transcriptional regulator, Cro/CI family [Streptococcus agalactiae A909]EPW70458.1 repressor [Streptococcus agalactiae BSU260]MCC9934020.1 helix-turn-helix transcriptional regulator [Streptococcus agalactiae]